MKEIKKDSLLKLKDGRIVKVINTPNSFMANGSYEVVIWVDNGLGAIGKPFWVKPEDIYYEIDMEHNDKIENYFEFIFDENGLHIIPKNIDLINIEVDKDGLKEIVFLYPENKHQKVTIYVGETEITDKNEICTVPPKPTFKDKIKQIVTGDETSNNNQEGPENEER